MKISVAMATYNGERYLSEQLQSFLFQTRQPHELVISDDCSTDSTMHIISEFSRLAPFNVRTYCNDINLGHIKNFERALSLCYGDIIFLSDQDDVWMPNKLETIIRVFELEKNLHLVRSNMLITDSRLNPSGVTKLGNIISCGGKTNDFNSGCGMAVSRDFLNVGLPIPDGLWGHDEWLGSIATALGVGSLLEEPLMYYRRHATNSSNWLVSQGRRLSVLDTIKAHGLADARDGWNNSIIRLNYIEERLADRRDVLTKIACDSDVESAITSLRHRKRSYAKRLRLVSKPRIYRLLGIASLWKDGVYTHFSGYKSAIKDLIRP